MTINISAYDTMACASLPVRHRVVEEIMRAGLAGATGVLKVATGKHESPFDLLSVQGGNSFADAVPYFNHPVLVPYPAGESNGQSQAFVVDVRHFGKFSGPLAEFLVRNGAEYSWALRRAILNQVWMDGRPEVLRDISTLPAATYAALVSECVARRFALDPAEQMIVAALSAYFYYGLFTDEEKFSEMEIPLLSKKISDITRVPMPMVHKLIEGLPVLATLDQFCQAVHDKVKNVALENFNLGTLLSVVRSTWFGHNSMEVVSVALEHIPTWLAIVSSSLESAVFKRSPLAKIAQRFDKNGAGKNFTRSLEVILGGAEAVHREDGSIDAVYEMNFDA